MDRISQFHQTLEAAFGPLNWRPVPDSKVHRFSVPGEGAGSPHNWYWLSRSGHKGCFGGLGCGGTFTANAQRPSTRFGHG